MASDSYHEPLDLIPEPTRNMHRALVSLIEELEAVDWYAQRADAAEDPDLAAILVHNGDEEKEHAAMALEWLRRRDPVLDRHLRTYLFTDSSIVEEEHMAEAPENGGGRASDSLDVGSLLGEALA
jgi:ferritin-like protein